MFWEELVGGLKKGPGEFNPPGPFVELNFES
jgi:hypothetical protein